MAKQIKGTDIIEARHLEEAIQQATMLQKAYLELDKQVKSTSSSLKAASKGATGGSVSDIKVITEAYKQSNEQKKAAIILQQNLIKVDKEREILAQNKIKTEAATIRLQQVKEKQYNKELADTKKLNSEYYQQSQRLNDLRQKYKDLILVQGRETAETRKMLAEITKLDAKLKKVDATVGQHQRSVGNYKKAIGGLTGALTSLGIGFSVFTVLRDAFKTVVDFEKATASLSAITGATGGELTALKGTILDLATSMKVGVTETTKLFEIVGSQMPQLLKDSAGMKAVAESAIILSKASGDSIESSTLAMASVMNQFKLEATESARVMNVLAAGSLVGSAGITDVSEAMKNFGSVASGANITVEESVALIEVLGKFGVVGAESGTKLRGSILKLQQASFGYASGQFEVNDALEEAKAKFDSLGSAMEQDAFLQKTFGAENISTGKILLSNIGLFNEYTAGVTGTNVATQQAAINSDTMAVAMEQMKAAWENAIIEVNAGTGAGEGFKEVVKELTVLIPPLVRGLGEILKNVAGLIKLVTGFKSAWSGAFTSMKSFGNAMADTLDLLLGWIPGMKQMNDYILRQKDAVISLTKEQERANKVNAEAIKYGNEILQQNKEEISDVSVLLDALMNENTTREEKNEIIAKLQADYPDYVKNIDLETASVEALTQAKRDLITQLLNEAIERKKAEQIALRTDKIIELELQKIGANANGIKYLDKQIQDLYASIPLIEDIATTVSENVESTVANIDLSGAFRNANSEIEALQFRIAELQKQLGQTNDPQRKSVINNEIVKANAELEKLLSTRTKMLDDALDKEGTGGDAVSGGGSGGGETALEKENKDLKENIALRKEMQNLPVFSLKRTEMTGITPNRVEDLPEDTKGVMDYVLEGWAKLDEERIKAEQEAAERRKKLAEESINLAKKLTDALGEEIDKRIEMEENELAAGKDKIDYLREQANLGNTDAAESLKAQEIANAKTTLEIEALEKKKRNLLLTVTALELASQKINAGDGNALSNAGTELTNFIAKLPKFYEGTEGTVAEALGKPHLNTFRDGYLARLDGKEMVLTGDKTASLQAAGLRTTSEVANAALNYSMGIGRNGNVASSESLIAKKLDSVERAIKGIDIPEHQFNYDQQTKLATETIRRQNLIIKNHQKTGGLFS